MLVERDSTTRLAPAAVPKIRDILAYLQAMATVEELRAVTSWKVHLMTGDRADTWALYVTRNWRITFRIDRQDSVIVDLNYEDYH